ncbi:MAG TPA: hypothetical protein VFI17_04545 [Solirubrobacterales bacterium]|nr:hypothetical protein [Solirubrobacterales bacterium]
MMAVLAPSALATTPAPGYEQFAGCPSQSENPTIEVCTHATINGGYFKMGNKNVPIKNQITLSGGFNGELSGFAANSKGGLKPVKQLVPGGVIGLTGLDWLINFLSIEALQLYAVTEAVGPPSLTSTLNMPIRVHLINPVLGNNCYVGSPSSPIQLHLTENTTSPPPPNTPISGTRFEFKSDENGILTLNNGVVVDNSFAAPGANGCVLTLFGFIPISINGLVNTASGLPAPAGTNATSQNMNMQLVSSSLVYP